MKIKVGVMFGGKTVEHEISIISAIQAIGHLNKEKYDVIPIYITKNNEFYIGEKIGDIKSYTDINSLLKESQRVIMLNEDGKVKLIRYPMKKFGKNELDYIDIAFPVVHGTNVEDGTLQGYLQMFNIPYVGCDVLSSAVGMDKYVMKTVLKDNGIPVLDCKCFTAKQYDDDVDAVIATVEEKIGYPVIVKPVNLGSSIGISKAENRDELYDSLDTAFRYASKVLIETAVQNLKEINCSVLGDYEEAEASECEEPVSSDKILTFAEKYIG
ncbi:MAG: D-alanine--D-alanine ligase, partial [Clostridia bacterium]|nr:D-alanine--D-alanine ligase [Clostridia bacterium]